MGVNKNTADRRQIFTLYGKSSSFNMRDLRIYEIIS